LWQSTKFPLRHKDIEVILQAISIASEDMRRLADIFHIEFQKGFPVKLDIPVVIGVSASVTFCNFVWTESDESLFRVPEDYTVI